MRLLRLLFDKMGSNWRLWLFFTVALVCFSKDRVCVCSDNNKQEAAPLQGAGGDMPKLIFDKGVLVGVDKERIDYTKPGGIPTILYLYLCLTHLLISGLNHEQHIWMVFWKSMKKENAIPN